MFNYLMCKIVEREYVLFKSNFARQSGFDVCAFEQNRSRKKVQKFRTQSDEIIFEGVFLLLCTYVFTRLFQLRFYYMTL